jgi:hypothetical protein
MNLSPLVERELRTGARRSSLFWLRGLLALILGAQAYELLNRNAPAPAAAAASGIALPPGLVSGALLFHHMATLLFFAVLLLGVLGADSLSRERREGTLGLLMLTDLTPQQIVLGKMLSASLRSFAILLGALPALMVPVLLGGVRGSDAVVTGLGLVNALFVSLAVALLVSALVRERRNAVAITLGVVLALAFGAEMLGGNFLGAPFKPLFRLAGLGGWITFTQLPPKLVWWFPVWFVCMHGLGWFFVFLAGHALAANWKDREHRQLLETPKAGAAWPPAATEDALVLGAAVPRASWLTDPRPWDPNPVRWRVERLGSIEGYLWIAVALSFIGQFCAASGSGSGSVAGWGLASFSGLVLVLGASAMLAWAGARFFADCRRQQDFELLLTTTAGGEMLSGQWQVLRKAMKVPFIVLLLVALPSGIAAASDYWNDHYRGFWNALPICLIPINIALETVALCWMGMYRGLLARHPFGAVLQAVIVVQGFPLVVLGGLALALRQIGLGDLEGLPGRMPAIVPILLLFLAKNVGLAFWTRRQLRKELRIRRFRKQNGPPDPALLPQAV